jgi:HEAT repeat protein
VAPYLAHPAPALRQAAVTALARLAPEASTPDFLRALEDPSAGVSKAARCALASRLDGVDGERVWEAFSRATEAHVRGNALSLLAVSGKWEGIGWIIRACGSSDATAARLARQHAQRWTERFNRTQAKPSAEQIRRMARALDDTASVLGANLERMLRFLMKGV